MEEKAIGVVVRYFAKIGVAAIRITEGELKVGDRIRIKGHSTDLEEEIESMQVGCPRHWGAISSQGGTGSTQPGIAHSSTHVHWPYIGSQYG